MLDDIDEQYGLVGEARCVGKKLSEFYGSWAEYREKRMKVAKIRLRVAAEKYLRYYGMNPRSYRVYMFRKPRKKVRTEAMFDYMMRNL